jgi:hypothetical protein
MTRLHWIDLESQTIGYWIIGLGRLERLIGVATTAHLRILESLVVAVVALVVQDFLL